MTIAVSDWWPSAAASIREIAESETITAPEARQQLFDILNGLAEMQPDTTGFLPSRGEQLAAVPDADLPRALRAIADAIDSRYVDITERDAGTAGIVGLD